MAQGYEILIIFHPEITNEEIQDQINKIKDAIIGSEGEFLKADKWEQRKLVYKIKGHTKGYFLIVYFLGNPRTLKALDTLLRYNEQVLRYQTVKLDKKFDINSLLEEASQEKVESSETEETIENKKVEETEETTSLQETTE